MRPKYSVIKICIGIVSVFCLSALFNHALAFDWVGRDNLDEELDHLARVRYSLDSPAWVHEQLLSARLTLSERYSKSRDQVEEALIERVKAGIDKPRGTDEFNIAIGSLGMLRFYATEKSVPMLKQLLEHEISTRRSQALEALFVAKGNEAAEYARYLLEEKKFEHFMGSYGRYAIYSALSAVAGMAKRNEIEREEEFFSSVTETMMEYLEIERRQSVSNVHLLDQRLKWLDLDPEYAASEYRRVLLEEMRNATEREERPHRFEYFQRELQELISPPEEVPRWIGRDDFEEELNVLTRTRYGGWAPPEDFWPIWTLPERYSKTRGQVEAALLERIQAGLDQPRFTREFETAIGSLGLLICFASEEAVSILEPLIDEERGNISTYALLGLFAAKGNAAADFARDLLEGKEDLSDYERYRVYHGFVTIVDMARRNLIEREEEFFENAGAAMREFLEKERGRSVSIVITSVRSIDWILRDIDQDYADSEYRRELLVEQSNLAERSYGRRNYFWWELWKLNNALQQDDSGE
jgi:hypothetical protein